MFERILVIVESHPATNAAVAQGIALARAHASELVFMAVVPQVTMPLADYPIESLDSTDVLKRAADSKAQLDLDAACQAAQEAGVRSRSVKSVAREGAECVVETARKLACDLIVVESLGRNSVMRLLAGSLIPGLITLSTLPVLVARHGSPAAELDPAVTPEAGAVRPEART